MNDLSFDELVDRLLAVDPRMKRELAEHLAAWAIYIDAEPVLTDEERVFREDWSRAQSALRKLVDAYDKRMKRDGAMSSEDEAFHARFASLVRDMTWTVRRAPRWGSKVGAYQFDPEAGSLVQAGLLTQRHFGQREGKSMRSVLRAALHVLRPGRGEYGSKSLGEQYRQALKTLGLADYAKNHGFKGAPPPPPLEEPILLDPRKLVAEYDSLVARARRRNATWRPPTRTG